MPGSITFHGFPYKKKLITILHKKTDIQKINGELFEIEKASPFQTLVH